MSSTLSELMNKDTFSPSTVSTAAASAASAASKAAESTAKAASTGSWMPPMWIIILLIVGVAIYFLPFLVNYLSLPEQVVEEKIQQEIDSSKKQKFDKDFIKTPEEIVDKEGVLEERGYCYIGTDRGVRSCIDVSPGDKCMSGKIFPRRDICVNPSLRL